MNILPKKRWHVRTKENIARVRRDEAKAAEEEKERLRRVALAEQEFRTSLLRKKAAERRGATGETSGDEQEKRELGFDTADKEAPIVGASGHINFFQHLEDGEKTGGPNEEYLREQKEEQEKYEKSIGYLTYLGQGSREETKQKAWFETLPVDRALDRAQADGEEVKKKAKDFEDPLKTVKKLVGESKPETGVKQALLPPSRPSVADASATRTRTGEPSSDLVLRKRARDAGSDDERHAKHKKHRKEKKRDKKYKKEKKRKKPDGERRSGSKKSRRRRSPSPGEASSSPSTDEEAEAEAARKIQLERLRAERLQREKEERQRADRLLRSLRGEEEPQQKVHEREPRLKQRYNAQFNPYLARQNYRGSDAGARRGR